MPDPSAAASDAGAVVDATNIPGTHSEAAAMPMTTRFITNPFVPAQCWPGDTIARPNSRFEPRRIRVKAKLAASLLLGGGAAVLGGVVTAAGLGVAAASGRALEANLTAGAAAGFVLAALLNVGFGVALGALLQSSAAAIAASFVLPTATGLLVVASKPVGQWLDSSTAFNWVLQNQWGGHVPQIAFSVILWVVVPLASGIVRTMRRDVT